MTTPDLSIIDSAFVAFRTKHTISTPCKRSPSQIQTPKVPYAPVTTAFGINSANSKLLLSINSTGLDDWITG